MILSAILALVLSAGNSLNNDSSYYSVKAGPSQSVSWLAFRHLGAYDAAVADSIRKDNPQLKDLDILKVGDVVRLRKSLDRRNLAPEEQIQMASRRGVVTFVKGSGEILRGGSLSEPLRANVFLSAGDVVVTRVGSLAEIILDNQSVLRLREKARLTLLQIQDKTQGGAGKIGTSVQLSAGRMWTKVRKWAGPMVGFEVRLPTAIAGVHGTVFETLAKENGSSEVRVLEGVVGVWALKDAQREGQEILVEKGHQLQVDHQGHPGEIRGLGKEDEFQRFNRLREAQEGSLQEARREAQQTLQDNTPKPADPNLPPEVQEMPDWHNKNGAGGQPVPNPR